MTTPCKNCLVFPMCNSKIRRDNTLQTGLDFIEVPVKPRHSCRGYKGKTRRVFENLKFLVRTN